jgi:uncharacterized membrane protein YjjP (DUF1212 family)
MQPHEDTETESWLPHGQQSPTNRNGQDTPTIQFFPASYPDSAHDITSDGKRKRVGFSQDITPPSDELEIASSTQDGHDGEPVLSMESTMPANTLRPIPAHSRRPNALDQELSSIRRTDISDSELSMQVHKVFGQPYVPKPKPAIRKTGHTPDFELSGMDVDNPDDDGTQKVRSGLDAHDRAQKLAARVGSFNASQVGSRRNSIDSSEMDSPHRRLQGHAEAEEDENDSDEDVLFQKRVQQSQLLEDTAHAEARRLVRTYTQRHTRPDSYYDTESPLHSGQMTPVAEQSHAEDYVAKPKKYRGGVLAALLKLQNQHEDDHSFAPSSRKHNHSRGWSTDISTVENTPGNSPQRSGASTPTQKHGLLHWSKKHGNDSLHSLSHLVGSSSTLAFPSKDFGEEVAERGKQHKVSRPGIGKRSKSSEAIASAFKRISRPRLEDQIKITVHIAQTLSRQKYLVKLCRALMEYGAPTHRLEGMIRIYSKHDPRLILAEYMKASSRVLEIESQYLYIPGCMIISFDDPTTHTTEVKIVRVSQGVNLGKLRDSHAIYKEVVHDLIGVEEATQRLDEVMGAKPKFNRWFLVFVYGLASVCVGPFAFGARLIDLPISFVLGCILGVLQLIVAPKSDLYANIFEITAAVVTSFIARGMGSIPDGRGGTIFCFSALAQSSIALILPGYTVLCASLELQSRSIVAGSVRMVYAIIYSLFLGFGITIGTVLYGMMDHNASSKTTCATSMPGYWFFFFVPGFTMCLIIINQAKWKQAPVMLIISFSGYLVNYFCSKRFSGNTQVSQTLGALTIGVMANLYARLGRYADNFFIRIWEDNIRPLFLRTRDRLQNVEAPLRRLASLEEGSKEKEKDKEPRKPRRERVGYGMAAAAMLPAIFVQVPSGLAVSGSLVSGITSANQILSNVTGTTVVSSGSDGSAINSAAFNVGYSVIQVAIGITVGLFLSAVIVYPFGKGRSRSGLFSF